MGIFCLHCWTLGLGCKAGHYVSRILHYGWRFGTLLGKQSLCFHKDSKLRFPALLETAVSASWGSTPTPPEQPRAETGCAFGSRTLLSLLYRDRSARTHYRDGVSYLFFSVRCSACGYNLTKNYDLYAIMKM